MNATLPGLSRQQFHVLEALGHYRFLTVEQMLRLGISRNAKSLREKSLFALRYHQCIQSQKIGAFYPDIHQLTRKGVQLLHVLNGAELNEAAASKQHPFSPLFARHRLAQVDVQIGLNHWAKTRGDAELLLELHDFIGEPKTGRGKPKPATELVVPDLINSIIPDGTFAVGLKTGAVAVYLVEIHRATQSKAVTEQLSRYFAAIKSGAIQQKYGYRTHPIVCSVHDQPSVLKSVKTRLNAHPSFCQFKRNFVFHALDDLNDDFTAGWHFADDAPANPFPLPNPKNDARA